MTAPRPDRPTEPASPRTPWPAGAERPSSGWRDTSFVPQLLGGVVLGMGLTVLSVALDRAGLPSPLPSSLSWHHPDRVRDDALARLRAERFLDLEVAVVEAVVAGDLPVERRERALRYLWRNGGDAGLRGWAAAELAPRDDPGGPETGPIVAASGLPADGGPWLSAWLEPPASEVVVSLVADAEPGVTWLDELPVDAVSDDPAPVSEPATPPTEAPSFEAPASSPAPEPAPEPAAVAEEPAGASADTAPPPEIAAKPADTSPEPAVADASPGPVGEEEAASVLPEAAVSLEPQVTAVSTFVDAERGDAASIEPVVTAHIGQLRQCYERGLEFDPALGGMLDLELNIHNGRVSAVSVVAENLGDEIAIRCMTDRIRHWRFDTGVSGQAGYRFGFDLTSG